MFCACHVRSVQWGGTPRPAVTFKLNYKKAEINRMIPSQGKIKPKIKFDTAMVGRFFFVVATKIKINCKIRNAPPKKIDLVFKGKTIITQNWSEMP